MPRHRHWPVTMQAGGVVLRPMRRADEVRWTTTRELDWDWLPKSPACQRRHIFAVGDWVG